LIAALLHHLGEPATATRLRRMAAGAPPSAPLSLRFDLGVTSSDWLANVPADAPFWYEARPVRGQYRLAVGHALQVASAGAQRFAALDNAFSGLAAAWRHDGSARAFCGFAFDSCAQGPLPNALLAVPALLFEADDEGCRATFTTTAGRLAEAPADWQRLLSNPSSRPPSTIRPAGADTTLADRAWLGRVHAALRHIASGRAEKIVLARERRLSVASPPAPARLLAALIRQQPASTVFAHGTGNSVFLGASPERLVRVQGRQVVADALAGTAWPGSAALDGAKNRHEQALVGTAVLDALAGACSAPPQAGPLETCQAGGVAHLRTRIAGELRPGVSLFELLRTLHPTPAVGGFPGPAALTWLAAHGERRSAWYSGGFGSLTPGGDGEFVVPLRSALLHGQCIDLQAGAGIVAGSDPAQELAETEAKFATLLDAVATLTEDVGREAG
jgi:isochorismate synthase